MDVYGPPLPPGFKLPQHSDDDDSDCEPSVKKAKVIGPQISTFLKSKHDSNENSNLSVEDETDKIIGPVLPPSFKQKGDDNDDDICGPMPAETKLDYNIVDIIEKRAASMKDRLGMKEDSTAVETSQREEWMIVPDTSRRNQLGAISRCLAPGSKSSKKEEPLRNIEEDKKTTKELKKYNKSKRGESLLDMHKKKKKKEKKKKHEKQERKAFDRDEIAVRHFTEKQVNSVIDKAKYLNSRFAPGRSQQYL